jgi:hypothetical protein
MRRDIFCSRADDEKREKFQSNKARETTSDKQIQLFEAILHNEERKFGSLLDSGDNILNGRLTNLGKFKLPWILQAHPTWTCVCAFFGSAACLRELVFRSVDLSAGDLLDRSLASFACAGGSFEVIDELVNLGVKFHERDRNKFWPAEYAAWSGRLDILLWMWTRGALNRDGKIGFDAPNGGVA